MVSFSQKIAAEGAGPSLYFRSASHVFEESLSCMFGPRKWDHSCVPFNRGNGHWFRQVLRNTSTAKGFSSGCPLLDVEGGVIFRAPVMEASVVWSSYGAHTLLQQEMSAAS